MSADIPPTLSKLISAVTHFLWPTVPQQKIEVPTPVPQPVDPIAPSGAPESLLKQLGPHRGRTLFINA
jgi:hypothetical protein